MKKRVSKFIVCFAAVLCLAVGFCVSASADVIGGAGLLGSALGSLGVDLLAGGSATMAMLAPWLSSDFSIVGALTGVADGYIKVGDESVIIDGVEYESIFLDPSMAAELHTQAFDFITQKAITSSSSGILKAGAGYLFGIPMYVNGQYYDSVTYYVGGDSFQIGETYGTVDRTWSDRSDRFSMSYPTASGTTGNNTFNVAKNNNSFYYRVSSSQVQVRYFYSGAEYGSLFGNPQPFDVDAFTYDYVSGIINADPLPATSGFQAFVPTQTLSQAGFSAGTYVIDGGTGTDEIIELIQLLDDIYGQEHVIDAEFTDQIVPPVPPQPVDTPLGEVPYDDFLDTFGQSIYGKLDSISDGIDTVGQVVAGAGTDVIDAVDTAGQSVVEELEVIGGAIDTAGQSVVDSVEESTGILEEAIEAVEAKVDELVDSSTESTTD